MIGYLTGKIISKKPTRILLDVNGVGYILNISVNTFEKLPDENSITSLYTYLAVREDSLTLFGFSSEAEKHMFELLISVNGIGPKLAQSVLSGIQIDDLKNALITGNINRIIAIPGIGRKTAERMMLDLKDKVDAISEERELPASFKIKDDAIAALTTLGYNSKTADKIIRDILTANPSIQIEELIKQALAQLNK
ncbi:MAG: Holliday junction branch migration protein RuvA [Ignavibacteriales bacterium]|nr:MAG: Holliday junction branch migration protein RuvA [Ignavibacteriales bacterium]